MHHGVALTRAGHFDVAADELARARDLCEEQGFRYTGSVVHWAAAEFAEAIGDYATALAERDAERELLAGLHNDRNLAGCHAHRTTLLRRLGRDAHAEVAASAAREAAARVGDPALVDDIERALAGNERASL
jgi:hypothetical protein